MGFRAGSLELWDGQSDVLVLSFGVCFEGASSGSVGLVAFRLFSFLWLISGGRYEEQIFGVDFQLGKIRPGKIQRIRFTRRDVWSIRVRYEVLVGWFSMPLEWCCPCEGCCA